MSSFEVRAFRRADRDQLTRLVNHHAAAVVPGASVSVNTVLSQLEREPGEFIVDPWVGERCTLVAEQAGAIVAAALVLRYRDDTDVGESYRNAGEVRWLLFRPLAPDTNPFWEDGHDAANALMRACLAQFDAWRVTRHHADGTLPHPGIYGVPAQWPHIEHLYQEHSFEHVGSTEIVLIADLDSIDEPGEPPLPGLGLQRAVGINGVRLTADLDSQLAGFIEVDHLDPGQRHPRAGALADIGNLHVVGDHRRQGVGSWLVQHAARWLRLGHADRLLAYASPDETGILGFLARHHFEEITTTRRGWIRNPNVPPAPTP